MPSPWTRSLRRWRALLSRSVHVVTDDPGFSVEGTRRLPDEGDGDLNRALHHASLRVRLAEPGLAVAAMCADLPSLRTEDLTAALGAGLTPRWFVADADGTGTTLLAAAPGVGLDPHFGAGSARRHEESGAAPVRAELATLRRDVDTEDDLLAARALGVGVHTARALETSATGSLMRTARSGGDLDGHRRFSMLRVVLLA